MVLRCEGMRTRKEVEDYLNSIRDTYDEVVGDQDTDTTEKEMVIMEIQIETLEWVLK